MLHAVFCRKILSVLAVLSFTFGCKAQSALETTVLQQYPGAKASIPANNKGLAKGLFHIYGKNLGVPEGKVRLPGSAPKSAEEASQSFLEQQKTTLGVDHIATDLQINKVTSDKFGNSHFRYKRYLQGLQLEGMEVLVHVDAQNDITGINGYITPVTEELKRKVSAHLVGGKLFLSLQAVVEAIATDLKIDLHQLKILKADPLVITDAPFVIWQVDVVLKNNLARYIYRIADNPARQILNKRSNIQS